MDEYKPINVHDILLTAVRDGGTGEINSTFQMNHFYCLPNSNSVTLKNWTAVAHSQQYRPSNDNIRSLIRIRH